MDQTIVRQGPSPSVHAAWLRSRPATLPIIAGMFVAIVIIEAIIVASATRPGLGELLALYTSTT